MVCTSLKKNHREASHDDKVCGTVLDERVSGDLIRSATGHHFVILQHWKTMNNTEQCHEQHHLWGFNVIHQTASFVGIQCYSSYIGLVRTSNNKNIFNISAD